MTVRDLRRLDDDELRQVALDHPYPLLFATVSGAHLYGFPSRDSDVDLRGVHRLTLDELVGLRPGPGTIDRTWDHRGAEIDLVTHDAGKFFRLLLAPNGYVAEQVLSPLVVLTSAAHEELVSLIPGTLTHRHARHYQGFARNTWQEHTRTGELKALLYTFRVLLTGIHLMRSGEVEAHLPALLTLIPTAPDHLPELIEVKGEQEHGELPEPLRSRVAARALTDVTTLQAELEDAEKGSPLPGRSTAEPGLHDLLLRVRALG